MWTPLILVCMAEACRTLAGPMVMTEQDCWVSIQQGAAEIQQIDASVRLVDAQCVRWDERA
jgi:hypothetical protein